ncbi:hypothetical protein B0H14DRAFT_3599389 [Mycena olivaceomarginata]|nr:hypothetical protein B0H14DRAFT_3599389 [Mycena olivaceomarginata]
MSLTPRFLNASGDLVTTKILDSVGVAIIVNSVVDKWDIHSGILYHLQQEHHPTDAARNHVIERTHGLTVVDKYPTIDLTVTPRRAFSGIKIIRGQYGCSRCPFAAVKKVVQSHIRDKHKDGGGKAVAGFVTQVLNSGGQNAKRHIRVFEQSDDLPTSSPIPPLTPTQSGASSPAPPPSSPGKSFWDIFSEFDPKAYRAEELSNSRLISPWLMRNGRHKLIEPYRDHIDELIQLASVPSKDEFPALHAAISAYFTYACDLIEHTNEVVLQRLNSADPEKERQTFGQYINVVVRLLASLLRDAEHYQLPTTDQLKAALESFSATIRDPTEVEEHCSKLHQVLLALWKTRWEATEEHVIHDPTMCFLALFSLGPSGEFVGPKQTTGPIAKLCWGIRLCMLTEIHQLVKDGRCADQMEAFEQVAAFVTEHEVTTFHHLRSLTHYATTVALGTMQLPSIIWTDRENWTQLLYMGNSFSLPQLQEILSKLEERIIELWETRVMLDLGLHVEYGDLADNLTNTKPGYSLITDPLNPFAAHRHSFVKALLDNPQLEAWFVYLASDIPDPQLNMDAARGWLSDLAELEGLIMLYTELTPGATIRGTELWSMLVENTLYRLRNLMGFGKFVALIRQYLRQDYQHRSEGPTHSACCQSLEQFLASRVFPDDDATVEMYGNMLFMDFGKVFSTDKLSALMAMWAGPVIGWKLTVAPHRQINTAFRRKHCRAAPDEEDDDNVVAMLQELQAGHGRSIDHEYYGLSHNALLGVTEEVLFQFLNSSVLWQKAIRVVPGGLGLPYHQATREHFEALELQETVKKASTAGGSDPVVVQLLTNLVQSQQAMLKSQQTMLSRINTLEAELRSHRLQPAQVARSPWGSQLSHLLAPVQSTETPLSHLLAPTPMEGVIETNGSPDNINLLASSGPNRDQDDIDLLELSPPNRAPPTRDLLESLRRLLGPTATWKDKMQYDAVAEIAAMRGDVIVALKTGAGKTIMAIILSLVENGITIIVLPLNSLMDDWERRLKEFGIGYERWMGAQNPHLDGSHNLILVSCDMLRQETFKKEIAELNARRPVMRYVFGEAFFYASSDDFRADTFKEPCDIRHIDAQMVLMGATITPAIQAYLTKAFFLKNPVRIADTSDRRELVTLICHSCDTLDDQLAVAKNIISNFEASHVWDDSSRFLVFVNSLPEGNKAAEQLDLDFYHGKLNDEERGKKFNRWVDGVKLFWSLLERI